MGGTRRSVMQHQFSQVPRADIPRSSFNRSCGLKTAFDASFLVPVFVDEALPGDTFNCRMTAFTRMATPLFPFMDNVFLDSFFFSVPTRILWENWKRFNGEQDNPDDSTDYLIPTMSAPEEGYENGSLSDYLGIPTQVPNIEHSTLWHRAYNKIYNEWFRDQNLVDSVPEPFDDGPDDPNQFHLLKRGKRHDYFTSALPWPQKGPAVEIPIGDTADVDLQNVTVDITGEDYPTFFSSAHLLHDGTYAQFSGGPSGTPATWDNPNLDADVGGSATADLSTATGATINEWRQAFQLQKMLERDARGGTRYTEQIQAHFGVTSPDGRQQRPEYLGGGSIRINVNPVAQTSSTDEVSPQGNLSAYATGAIRNHGFTKSFTEHSIIIGLVNVRADLTYQQGLERMFSRQTRYDFYWPALSHIGEQAILNKEIYAQGTPTDNEVWGYQERSAEYRYKPSKITGKFRSNDDQSLDSWHLAQDFENLPVLNQDFIEEDVPIDRVITLPNEPHFLFDAYFTLKCARPMPVFSVPGLIDHF